MATENTGANENKKAGEGAKKPRPAADGKTPVKKKKIIIVTGNSSKSRQSSGQRGAYSSGSYSSAGTGSFSSGSGRKPRPAGQQSGPRREQPAGRQKAESKPVPHKIIRPTVKPTQMEVDFHKPEPAARQPRRQEETAPVKEEIKVQTPVAEAAEQVKTAVETPVAAQIPAEKPVVEEASAVSAAEEKAVQKAEETAAPKAEEKSAPKAETAEREAEAKPAAEAAAPAAQSAAAESTEDKAQSAQTGRDSRSGSQRDRNAQGQGGRRDGAQSGSRREGGRSGDQGGFRREGGRSGDQGGFRREGGRAGDQGGFRREGGRAGDQTGSRREGGRAGDQGGFRREGGRAGDQGGFRREGGRTGAGRIGEQGGFAGRSAKPGQGMRGAGAPAAGRQGTRPGAAEGGRRRSAGRPGEGEGFADKHRDDNKRKKDQDRDKRSKKDFMYNEDENNRRSGNKAGRFIRPEKKAEAPVEEQIKTIVIPEKLTIRELAEAMHMNPSEIIKKLFLAGRIMTPNSEVEYEDAEKIALDYDILCEKEQKVDVIEELLREEEDSEEDMETRPPVICVMGHVDHGKTSLLDAIRKTNVTRGEAGGITQAIGAYTISLDGRSITFLDTPGHEAFTAMRMRGANSTDIAVLVVAADDGVMPQTVEAINHAKAAGVEIIVAVNKIDKPGANVEKVKQEMTEYELVPTDWGGSTEYVPVSAKTGEGIEDLLETILLTADILELKANPNRKARGLVLEAKLDKGRGPVANVLVQKGTLHIGDFISAGASSGKVRAMIDDKGRRIKEAKPSQPVEILGLSDVPSAGEVIIAHESNDQAKAYAETYKNQHKEELIEDTKMRMNLDDLFNQMKEGNLKEFNLIIKADVQGSVEALKQSLLKLSNEEVVVKVIHGGVGAITESDVTLASASNAVIIGFNVRPDATAKAMAEHEGVDIRLYKVIYQAIDAVEAALKGMLAPVYEERVIGHVEVRMLFKASSVGNIAGSYVLDGSIRRGCKCRITRAGEQIYEGDLASLKRFKDDVKEVKAGFECGLVFDGFDKMQVGDIVEAYDLVEVPRT
ncbi:MAG: translation initiation factor IF-2 [Lachnospiraceae bacterium]|nr:translation initiation factor IF-2 [Lachnospiraceae bacterium]